MITLFVTSAGSSNACVTEPFVWFCSRNGNGTSGKPREPRHLAWMWVWLLQQPWNRTNIKSWKHWNSWNSLFWSFGQRLTYLKNRVLCFPPLNFISWKPKRVREQQLGFPDFANFGCFYLAFTCNFGQPISMIVLEYHDAPFLWNKLKKAARGNIHKTYTSPCCTFPIPNAFFFAMLSAVVWSTAVEKGQHFGLADSRCWAEILPRSLARISVR